ncbi:163_t:CDS:2, partial [Gigaspora margarita]
FDQNNQLFVSDTLSIEKNLPTKQEALWFKLLQPYKTVIDSGQALGYNSNDGLSDK